MERAVRLIVMFAAMLLAIFLVIVPTAGAAGTAKVEGEWNLTIETPNGTGTPSVIFKQDGENLTGTYKGRFGDTALKGTVRGNDIKFTFTVSPQGQDMVVEYTGTVDGDTMKGKAKFGEMFQGNFTGKKKTAEAAPTPAPK
jgi:hypothetical protein